MYRKRCFFLANIISVVDQNKKITIPTAHKKLIFSILKITPYIVMII